MSEAKPDLEVISPITAEIEINGIKATVNRLRTREFLALIRVLGAAFGDNVSNLKFDFTAGAEAVTDQVIALMVMALPVATNEFIQFLTQVVTAKDQTQGLALAQYMADNPDIDVLLEVFEILATQEKDDLVGLAGKAQAMWSRVAPLYTQKKATPKPSEPATSGKAARSSSRST